ncbi:Uncharacterised protein [Mycobacteroides abscessus subsp. abscessus]|nr:Uncharacterised protein [Mycobacteroides abscessus subsp. abscessus]
MRMTYEPISVRRRLAGSVFIFAIWTASVSISSI